jgi:hypothetical protein
VPRLPTARRRAALAAVLAGTATIAGCGVARDPTRAARAADAAPTARAGGSAARAGGSAAADLAQAQRTHEYPGPAPRQTVAGGWRTATGAVLAFATAYINWTADTASEHLRALSEVSVGQARSAMTLAAAEIAGDGELRRGGIANQGVVEAIAAVRGHPGEYAVVTRERTTATDSTAYQGLDPVWHVALATVTGIAGGLWVLSGWQPES